MKKKQTLFGDVLETVTKYFLILVIVVVVFVLLSGIRIVESGNKALVLRFGKLTGDSYEEQIHEPGLLFAFPYFVDEVIIVPTGSVFEQSVTTHYTGDENDLSGIAGGYLITGDQNIAVVSASVKYTITDPVRYVLNVADAPALINATVSSAMVNEAANMDVDDLLTTKKDEYASAVHRFATSKLNMMEAGISITAVELTQVAVPEEVRPTFESLNAATVQAETIEQRALTAAESIKLQATVTAHKLETDALSTKTDGINAANEQLAQFWALIGELEKERAWIVSEYAEAHGHSAEYDPNAITQCDRCERLYQEKEQAICDRIYAEKFNAIMKNLGNNVYLMSGDIDSKLYINP